MKKSCKGRAGRAARRFQMVPNCGVVFFLLESPAKLAPVLGPIFWFLFALKRLSN